MSPRSDPPDLGPYTEQSLAGTTHLIFEPLQFIEKLAALVGPPRANLLHDHGYLAPCASWRKKIVPAPPEPEPARHIDAPLERFGQPPPLPPRPTGTRWFPWALLLWRSLQIDALLCPRCGSRMKILAYLTDPPVVEAVLDALERPSQAPTVSPARSQLQLEYCQALPAHGLPAERAFWGFRAKWLASGRLNQASRR